jgi:hypothetical protein
MEWIETMVNRYGEVGESQPWVATCVVCDRVLGRKVESSVWPILRLATVSGRGRVDIGEPWPDPTTPVGLERLLAIAEGLAVTEWEIRYGGVK